MDTVPMIKSVTKTTSSQVSVEKRPCDGEQPTFMSEGCVTPSKEEQMKDAHCVPRTNPCFLYFGFR